MDEQKARILLQKYNDGTANAEERQMVEAYFFRYLRKKDQPVNNHLLTENLAAIRKRVLSHAALEQPMGKRSAFLRTTAVAASVLLCLSIGFYYYQQKTKTEKQQLAQNQILPGGNKAVLTLANGKKIALTSAVNGVLATQSGVQIIKSADGQLTYTIADVPGNSVPPEYNTIETPKGGQYQVKLPDGTDVWLNAASTLRYPTSFSQEKNRTVELSGEGYFEVAKDKSHPFIVKSGQQEVEVLGTHFNINSYTDEPAATTTLLEGKVRVSGKSGSGILSPGQQSRIGGEQFRIAAADTEQAVAWKNGDFAFEGTPLKTIMRQISRWYNVEVSYRGMSAEVEFGGSISRNKDIKDVLKVLETTGGVHFEIKGRSITVTP